MRIVGTTFGCDRHTPLRAIAIGFDPSAAERAKQFLAAFTGSLDISANRPFLDDLAETAAWEAFCRW